MGKRVEPEDAATFRAAVADVKPLKAKVRIAPPAGRPRPRPRRPVAGSAAGLDELMPILPADSDMQPGAVLSFQRGGVRTQVMRRLRRGLYPADDQLDLHGLTQTDAREHLAHFIEASRAAGLRCVRIIHGKGYRSGARGPILKTAVDAWLRRHLDVMAFVSAKAIDGGTGALYVLLRA